MNIGLALGSGSARGWSHIGVINALADQGIVPNIICGTSIGALVGASYAFDNLHKLEDWVRSLTKFETAKYLDVNVSFNGFVDTGRLHNFLNEFVASDSMLIESGTKQYASVATDLETGREVWLTKGPVLEAVWSSISLPGLFPAIRNNDKWLVDGGLVNPVPVSLCRALGADIVIAVNLNGDILGKHFKKPGNQESKNVGLVEKISDWVSEYATPIFAEKESEEQPPNLLEAVASSINITQDRITRSRMAGDPPDILLSPRLSHIGLLEFYRAGESIDEGGMCVKRMLSEIQHTLDMA